MASTSTATSAVFGQSASKTPFAEVRHYRRLVRPQCQVRSTDQAACCRGGGGCPGVRGAREWPRFVSAATDASSHDQLFVPRHAFRLGIGKTDVGLDWASIQPARPRRRYRVLDVIIASPVQWPDWRWICSPKSPRCRMATTGPLQSLVCFWGGSHRSKGLASSPDTARQSGFEKSNPRGRSPSRTGRRPVY